MKPEKVLSRVAVLCREYGAEKVILCGSRAKGAARERKNKNIYKNEGCRIRICGIPHF